jgi:hypothetical protein
MSSSSDSSDKYSGKPCEQRKANGDPCNSPLRGDAQPFFFSSFAQRAYSVSSAS